MKIARLGYLHTLACTALLCSLIFLSLPAAAAKPPLIAAAASLQFALPEIAKSFEKETGQSVTLVFGSSGNFTRQIKQGAPFELFFSANENFVTDLFKNGFTLDTGVVYATGRLVLALPLDTSLKTNAAPGELANEIASDRVERFAIANPEHAPYGERAKQVLQHLGIWKSMQAKLVIGENVAQAAQFALSTNAQGGIIALAQIKSPGMDSRAHYHILAEHLHEPLLQRMALLNSSGSVAREFYEYMQHPNAQTIMESFGFQAADL